MAIRKKGLAGTPCFSKIPELVDPISKSPSPITRDIQQWTDAYVDSGMTGKEAIIKAVEDCIRLVEVERTEIHKLIGQKGESINDSQPRETAEIMRETGIRDQGPGKENQPPVPGPQSPVDQAAHEAATSPANEIPEPTQAQIEAGNYKKGHVDFQGLDISIENPAGSMRKGVDTNGKAWETELAHHYGYIKGTIGRDKDHIDVFIGPEHDSEKVFVVDQIDPASKKFDEHKVMLGFDSLASARAGYLANYDKSGKSRIGAITESSLDEFKQWLKDGDTKREFASAVEKAATSGPSAAPIKSESKNKVVDAGEELTYNKRNRIKSGIKWADVQDKNDALKAREVQKGNVYPKPDYEALVTDGMEPIVAHIVKQVYDSIAAKPDVRGIASDADFQTYITAVNRVMEGALRWANDKAAVAAWVGKQAKSAGAMLGRSTSLSDLTPSTSLYDTIYPGGWREFSSEVHILGGNKALKALQPGYNETRRAIKEIDLGWPAKTEAWQRQGYKIVSSDGFEVKEVPQGKDRGSIFFVRKPTGSGNYQYLDAAHFYSRDEAQKYLDDMKPALLFNKRGRLVDSFDTEDLAKDAARNAIKKEDSGATIKERGMNVADAERTGPRHREEGEDITAEKLMDTIGFKGVNFGNWVPNDERQMHLNHAYDSFLDLADVLNLPPRALSLNGMLGLAIGAQGSGSYAAHFVPGVNEINITRTMGAGSVAHEWAHAVDHYFATQAGFAGAGAPWMTVLQKNGAKGEVRPEIIKAISDIVQTMQKREATPEELAVRAKTAEESGRRKLESWLKYFEKEFSGNESAAGELAVLMDSIRKGDYQRGEEAYVTIVPGRGRSMGTAVLSIVADVRDLAKKYKLRIPTDNIKALHSNVAYVKFLEDREEGDHKPQLTMTKFQAAANKLDAERGKTSKPYWSTPLEMFARAFDSYVTDKLEAKAQANSYLSHTGRESDTVPMGDERKTINAAFDKLIGELKTKETDKGIALYKQAADATVTGLKVSAIAHIPGRHGEAVQSVSDLPGHVQEQMRADGVTAAKGVYDPVADRVYLVADHIADAKESATLVLSHELTHKGLAALGEQGRQYLKAIAIGHPKEMAAIVQQAKEQGRTISRIDAANEYLAREGETKLNPKLWQRIVDLVKDAWAKLTGKPAGDKEVREVLAKVRESLQESRDPGYMMAQSFRANIAKFFDGSDYESIPHHFEVAIPSAKLKEAGITATIQLKKTTIKRKMGEDADHAYTKEVLNQLPSSVNDPIMVIEHPNGNKDVVTGMKINNRQVLVAIKTIQVGPQMEIASIRTIFGKPDSAIQGWLRGGRRVWYDKEKAHKWLELSRATTQPVYPGINELSANSIPFSDETVKSSAAHIQYMTAWHGSPIQAKFKLVDRTPTGIRAEDVRPWVKTLPIAGHVNVVQSIEDLPPAARSQIKAARVNPNRVKAMELHGTIYLIADNVEDMHTAKALVIGHELAHAGQTEKIVDFAVDWFKRTKGRKGEPFESAHALLERIAYRYGYDLENEAHYRRAVQEATAAIAERVADGKFAKAGLMTALFIRIKYWLRKAGLINHVSDSELSLAVAEMLRIGEKRLSTGLGGEQAQFAKSVSEIENIILQSDRPGNIHLKADLGEASAWLADEAEKAGLEIHGFKHIIDSSAIRHIRKQHGDMEKEASRGQIGITDADILKLPEVIAHPDKVAFGTVNRIGRDQIVYLKKLEDGTTLYFEEVRTGRRELAAVTVRKYPATMDAVSILATLNPNARSDGGNEIIITNGPEQSTKYAKFALLDESIAAHAAKISAPQKVSDMTKGLFELVSQSIPERLKANIGKVFSNPWFGSEGKPIRRKVVNLNIERSQNRNEIISDLFKASEGYSGVEGLDNILKKASKEEHKQFNELIKYGDRNDVAQVFTQDELYRGKTPFGKLSRNVVEAYKAFQEVMQAANRVRFQQLDELSLLPYKDQEWYDDLIELLNGNAQRTAGMTEKEAGEFHRLIRSLKRDLTDEQLRKGDNPAKIEATDKIIAAYRDFWKQVDQTEKRNQGNMLSAFRDILGYRGELDKLKNEWGRLKGYAPRNRKDGDWHVSVYTTNDEGERVKVYMKPTITEAGAKSHVAEVRANLKQYLKSNFDPDAKYEVEYERNQATPPELLAWKGSEVAVEALLNQAFDRAGMTGKMSVEQWQSLKHEVFQEIAKQIMAQGFGRHGISREAQFIEGYKDEDYQAVIKEYISGMAGWLSKMRFAIETTAAAKDISKADPGDKVWVNDYVQDAMKNSTYMDEMAATARSVGAVYYLGFKVSSAVLNAFQNYTVGQAVLAGMMKKAGRKGEAVLMLAKAQRDMVMHATGKGKLTDEEIKVLQQAVRQGTAHAQTVRSMSGLSEQGFGNKWKKFVELGMTPFSWVEQYVNREPGVLAAYRAFKTTPGGTFDQAAFDKAEEFTNSAHFLMGNENLPEMVRKMGALGKSLYLFQGYTHNYMLLMANALKNGEFGVIARSLGAIAALGGVFALPGADDLDKWITKWFGVSYKLKFKGWMREHAKEYGTPGAAIEAFVNYGAPSVAGIDMSKAIGVNIPFVSDPDKTFGESLSGVWGGMVKKPVMAAQALGSNQYYRAIESMMPEFAANPMRAYRQITTGATTLAGKPIMDETGHQMKYSGMDFGKKVLGFNPADVSERTGMKSIERDLTSTWNDDRKDKLAALRVATTSEDIRKAVQDIYKFNRSLFQSQVKGLVTPISSESIQRARQYKPTKADRNRAQWERNQLD